MEENMMSQVELEQMVISVVHAELEANNDILVKRIYGMVKDQLARAVNDIKNNKES